MGKRNELTPFGQTVASRARRMVLDAVELKRSAQLLQEGCLGGHSHWARRGAYCTADAALSALHGLHASKSAGQPRIRPPSCRPTACANVDSTRLVVDLRSVTPADDLLIEDLGQMRGGFICRAGHPLAKLNTPITFAHLQRYPLASTSLNPELARLLITRYGPAADPRSR